MTPTVIIKKIATILKVVGVSKSLVVVLLLLVSILTFVVIVVRASRKRQAEAAKGLKPESPPQGGAPADEQEEQTRETGAFSRISYRDMRQSFIQATSRLKSKVATRDFRYKMPWFLAIGQADSGKSTVLANTDLDLPFGPPSLTTVKRPGCQWWFYDRGLVLDVDGDCILSNDGESADEAGWASLLKLLERNRPQRPLDGIILTIPCDELLELEDSTDLDIRARSRANLIHERLREAQRVLGMRVPIYVLVTKVDLIPGFRSFFAELPETSRQEMMGWSSPYSVDAGFTAEFVDEAFGGILAQLYQTQTEVFSEIEGVDDADGAFLFPDAFKQLGPALQTYMTRIFRDTGYSESYFCRGIYFTGEIEEVSSQGGNPISNTWSAKRPRFLRHLFERKIFSEHALARPVSRSYLTHNRATLIIRSVLAAVILLWSTGLWWSWGHLDAQAAKMHDRMQNMRAALRVHQAEGNRNHGKPQSDKLAIRILEGMSGINASSLWFFFIPSSWPAFTSLHSNIVGSMTRAFDEVIMITLRDDLEVRALEVVRQPVAKGAPASAPILQPLVDVPRLIEDDPQFILLKIYVSDLTVLEANIKNFNHLQDEGFADLKKFAGVVKYASEIDLPSGFFERADYYKEALKESGVEKISLAPFRVTVEGSIDELTSRFYSSAFEGNALLHRLQNIKLQAEDVMGGVGMASHGIPVLARLKSNIAEIRDFLDRPETLWMGSDLLDFGPTYDDLLRQLRQSSLVSEGLVRSIEEEGAVGFGAMKQQLAGYRIASRRGVGSPILERSGATYLLKLSPDVVELESHLDALLENAFSSQQDVSAFDAYLPPRTRLMWDVDLLEDALSLVSQYEEFAKKDLQEFSHDMRQSVRVAALEQLQINVMDRVARAQKLEPAAQGFSPRYSEDELRSETRSLKEAMKPLGAILSTFDRYGMESSRDRLYQLLIAQALDQLRRVDDLLEEEGFYKIDDLSTWDGRTPITQVLFDARNSSQVNYYLDSQRSRLQYIAQEYAAPSVMFMSNAAITRSPIRMPLLSRWEDIINEFSGDQAKQAGSSLTVLENLIRSELDGITLDTFAHRIPELEMESQPGDFFLGRRATMLTDINNRCMEIAELSVVEGYGAIRSLFNERLSGRYPFADHPGERSADLTALRAFYRIFDEHGPLAAEVFRMQNAEPDALTFIKQMTDLRTFLGAFLSLDEQKRISEPTVDFEVAFRQNREREVGGNQIIEWSLQVGDREITHADEQKTGRWRYGDQVNLSLRWAKDADYVPTKVSAPAEIGSDRLTVDYNYESIWSLVDLIQRQSASPDDFDSFRDPEPHTLKLTVGTRRAKQKIRKGETPKVEQTARVFVRISLFTPETKEPLVLPNFPRSAPEIEVGRPLQDGGGRP
jgi:type VI secretion system protein ImpL